MKKQLGEPRSIIRKNLNVRLGKRLGAEWTAAGIRKRSRGSFISCDSILKGGVNGPRLMCLPLNSNGNSDSPFVTNWGTISSCPFSSCKSYIVDIHVLATNAPIIAFPRLVLARRNSLAGWAHLLRNCDGNYKCSKQESWVGRRGIDTKLQIGCASPSYFCAY